MQFLRSASRGGDSRPSLPLFAEAWRGHTHLGRAGAGGWAWGQSRCLHAALGSHVLLAAPERGQEPIPLLAGSWRRAAAVQQGSHAVSPMLGLEAKLSSGSAHDLGQVTTMSLGASPVKGRTPDPQPLRRSRPRHRTLQPRALACDGLAFVSVWLLCPQQSGSFPESCRPPDPPPRLASPRAHSPLPGARTSHGHGQSPLLPPPRERSKTPAMTTGPIPSPSGPGNRTQGAGWGC